MKVFLFGTLCAFAIGCGGGIAQQPSVREPTAVTAQRLTTELASDSAEGANVGVSSQDASAEEPSNDADGNEGEVDTANFLRMLTEREQSD